VQIRKSDVGQSSQASGEDLPIWRHLASQLPGRDVNQIRDRYQNYLDPSLLDASIPWRETEANILFQKQMELGNQWSKIAAFLPGRSRMVIKNYWYNNLVSQERAVKRILKQR
jgi:Myb-like DNA-binding domain